VLPFIGGAGKTFRWCSTRERHGILHRHQSQAVLIRDERVEESFGSFGVEFTINQGRLDEMKALPRYIGTSYFSAQK
jgi:hypothetical protein